MSQATLTVGKRTLCVDADGISVFPVDNGIRSIAAWIATPIHSTNGAGRINYCPELPAELKHIIHGVLEANLAIQPLMDWVIEYGPANLARELEAMQADINAGFVAGCE